MYSADTLFCRDLGDVFLVVVGTQNPTDDEIDRYIEAVVPFLKNRVHASFFFYSLGGMVTLSQAARIWRAPGANTFFKGIYGAFLTKSTFARGVVNAMGMLGTQSKVHYKAFDIEQIDEAIRFIEAPPQKAPEIKDALASLLRALAP